MFSRCTKCCLEDNSHDVQPELVGSLRSVGQDSNPHLDSNSNFQQGGQPVGSLVSRGAADGHWVGEGELGWMNFMLKVMWPYLRVAIQRRGRSEMLEQASLTFARHPELRLIELSVVFDPGEVPPSVTGLRTYRKTHQTEQEFEGMQVDLDLVWLASKSNFQVQPRLKAVGPGGVTIDVKEVGVTGLELRGTASVVLAPLIVDEPCFGAQQVFFHDLPDLKMKISGLERFPLIKRILLSVMQRMTIAILSEAFVLPHRVMIKHRHDVALETLVQVKSPLPLGLLEVEVLEARNLLALDTAIVGKPTSDPYVLIRVGDAEIRTSTISRTTFPRWNDGPDYVPVYNLSQHVKVSVYDDDVLTEDDLMGWLEGLNVFILCQDMADPEHAAGGRWYKLSAKNEKGRDIDGGELKLRVRFLRQFKLAQEKDDFKRNLEDGKKFNCPRLLTVKLLGLEGQLTERFVGARATVEFKPGAKLGANGQPVPSEAETDKTPRSRIAKFAASLVSGALSIKQATQKAASITGFGFGSRTRGMPLSLRSGKTIPWASVLQNKTDRSGGALTLPPLVVRAIEQLHYREGFDTDKIAQIFGVETEVVKAAANLRANFEVVWHQALHFVQLPTEDPFGGSIEITVTVPVGLDTSPQLVIDRGKGRVADQSAQMAADSYGLVGAVRLNLSHEPILPDTHWRRRVRALLRRANPNGAVIVEAGEAGHFEHLRGESQCDGSLGEAVPGVLIEFLVEIRPMAPDDVTKFVEEGQAIDPDRERLRHQAHGSRVQVVNASRNSMAGTAA